VREPASQDGGQVTTQKTIGWVRRELLHVHARRLLPKEFLLPEYIGAPLYLGPNMPWSPLAVPVRTGPPRPTCR
jgi:hypothetical protein